MLTSISPFGERARGQRWMVTVTAYVAASTISGALVGAAFGGLGLTIDPTTTTALAIIAALALAGVALDLHRRGTRFPGPGRQVNENWLGAYRGWIYGAGFGLQLGAAFTTIVSASITYVAFACALLCGSIAGGALIGVTFGVTRAVPQLLTAGVDDPVALRTLMQRVDGARPRAQRGATTVQLLAAAVAVMAAVTLGAA